MDAALGIVIYCKRFMKTQLLLIVLQLVASGSDAYYTNFNLHRPGGYEHNPVVRPFVGSTESLVPYFSVMAGVHIGVPILLRRHHHKRLARLIELEGIADNSEGAIWSATRGH